MTVNVFAPTLGQIAFINGFLAGSCSSVDPGDSAIKVTLVPFIPKDATIEADRGASKFYVYGPEPVHTTQAFVPYEAVIKIERREIESKAVYQICMGSDDSSLTFPGTGESHYLGRGGIIQLVSSHADVVRALALAIFPDFEKADLRGWDPKRASIVGGEAIDRLREALMVCGAYGGTPEEIFIQGMRYACSLILQ